MRCSQTSNAPLRNICKQAGRNRAGKGALRQMKAIYSLRRFGEHANLDVKRHLPSKNLPVYSAGCPHHTGELAGSAQIAFTEREVELVGGALWNVFQFDYLRARLAEAGPDAASPWISLTLGVTGKDGIFVTFSLLLSPPFLFRCSQ